MQLGGLIPGMIAGLKHITGGGKIRLYIPPTLGYGSRDGLDDNGNVVIPANSILIYDVELLSVTQPQ
jgi:FKBP-type peptidyl-prolyl cis-trans isomerase FkpA